MRSRLGFVIVLVLAGGCLSPCLDAAGDELDLAIARFYDVDLDNPPEDDTLTEAAERLTAGGQASVAKIKAALARQGPAQGRKADSFRIAMAAVLWEVGKIEEVNTVAATLAAVDMERSFSPAYFTAFGLAQSHDVGVLPALVPFLKAHRGSVMVELHAMQLEWPDTADYLWGVVGPAAIPRLRDILRTSSDPDELTSCLYVLSRMADTGSLARARELLRSPDARVRCYAAFLLGRAGHPDDFGRLCDLLPSSDPSDIYSGCAALFEYGDLRAVPLILPLLTAKLPVAVRAEILVTLGHLPTPEGLRALWAADLGGAGGAEAMARFRGDAETALGMKWAEFSALPDAEQRSRIEQGLRRERDAGTQLQPTDRRPSHEDFVAACADWTQARRLMTGDSGWMEDRHVLAVATPADVAALLQVRAAVITRLSDEMMGEICDLDRLMIELARRAYRKDPGVCNKVEGI